MHQFGSRVGHWDRRVGEAGQLVIVPPAFGLRISGFAFRVLGFGYRISGFDLGLRVSGSDFRFSG